MSGNVLSMAAHRATQEAQRAAEAAAKRPTWATSIRHCAAYAAKVRAEHVFERASIDFERIERGDTRHWWEGPADLKERIDENNRLWEVYIAILCHLAALPASDRREASIKRNTIGKQWLRCEGKLFESMQSGCLADDHLFPRSMKLARA